MKPLVMLREEFGKELVELINSSQLPPCIVLDVLRLSEKEVEKAAISQLETAKANWEKGQDEAEADNEQ